MTQPVSYETSHHNSVSVISREVAAVQRAAADVVRTLPTEQVVLLLRAFANQRCKQAPVVQARPFVCTPGRSFCARARGGGGGGGGPLCPSAPYASAARAACQHYRQETNRQTAGCHCEPPATQPQPAARPAAAHAAVSGRNVSNSRRNSDLRSRYTGFAESTPTIETSTLNPAGLCGGAGSPAAG